MPAVASVIVIMTQKTIKKMSNFHLFPSESPRLSSLDVLCILAGAHEFQSTYTKYEHIRVGKNTHTYTHVRSVCLSSCVFACTYIYIYKALSM